jgi:hypothetical protein
MVPYIRDSAAAVEYACTVVVEDWVVDFGGIGIGFTETAVANTASKSPSPSKSPKATSLTIGGDSNMVQQAVNKVTNSNQVNLLLGEDIFMKRPYL